jgi:hypothetical protein
MCSTLILLLEIKSLTIIINQGTWISAKINSVVTQTLPSANLQFILKRESAVDEQNRSGPYFALNQYFLLRVVYDSN